jgi:hypothetical protein
VRRDVEIADARSVGERHRDGGLQAALSPAGFEHVRDGAGAEGVAFKGVWRDQLQALISIHRKAVRLPAAIY